MAANTSATSAKNTKGAVGASGAGDAAEETALVEHTAVGRLTAARGLFNGPEVTPDDLYAEVLRGSIRRERETCVLHPHTELSMNTYFGRFPASYWQRWTVVDSVDLECDVTGSGKISVVATDIKSATRTVATHTVTSAKKQTVRLSAQLDKFIDGGALYAKLTTQDDELTVTNVRWTVVSPEKLRPAAIVICTFNRVEDCLTTLATLGADPEPLEGIDAIYVVDQGSDTLESRDRFKDVSKALDGRLRYIRQPNLGGAGGFTRGLYEVAEVSGAEHANVLFMDDDVLLDPEITIRLSAFANRTTSPMLVGGQMLRLLHPSYLLAGAEYADLKEFIPGKVVYNAVKDKDLLKEDYTTGQRPIGERRVDGDYNAWWSCLIPAEVVSAIGYPLPLFFQWDDVEYGYRAKEHGFRTVTLPGAGLWHADFDWKDLDEWTRYFNLRNGMITAALHSPMDAKHTARVVLAQVMRQLLSHQYGLAATIIRAVEDFLAGPKMLEDGGQAAAIAIRKLRAEYPDTVKHPVTEIPGLDPNDIPLVQAGPDPGMPRLVLAKRLIQLALGKSTHPIGAIPAYDTNWWHVSLFETAVVTDASQEAVRIRKRDRDQTIKIAMEGARLIKRVLEETPDVVAEYRAAMPTLTSRDNWKRLYDL
jgi:galactofuranosylgalactofuranosylrhamnosyl-N-acetylglucosaminyl-diphospho-decaprenol beta-1,5/1,6-galactofuranosyltransferase